MRLSGTRLAEAVSEPSGDRNLTFGVIRHLWRSPVPFVGFYPPEGVEIVENEPQGTLIRLRIPPEERV